MRRELSLLGAVGLGAGLMYFLGPVVGKRRRLARGVAGVADPPDVHDQPDDVSGLQGEGRRPGDRIDSRRAHRAPATRLLAYAAGCGLVANCLERRTPLATVLGTVGFGLFLRGLADLETKLLLGPGDDGRQGMGSPAAQHGLAREPEAEEVPASQMQPAGRHITPGGMGHLG